MMFSSPMWFLLALLALLPWIGPFAGKDRVQNSLRSFAFLVLAFALASPHFAVNETRSHRVWIVDHSTSVAESELQTVAENLRTFASSEKQHLVVIGEKSQQELSEEFPRFDTVTAISDSEVAGSSPLSSAMTRAQQLIPAGQTGSVSILTDGLATREDDARAVSSLRNREIPIHWIEASTADRPSMPLSVSIPSPLRKGSSSQVLVRVHPGPSQTGTVTMLVQDQVLVRATYALAAGQTVATARLEFEPPQAGFIEAEFQVNDNIDTSLKQSLPVLQPHRVLYFGKANADGADKLGEMLGSGFEVVAGDPQDTATAQQALESADLVMLDDLPAAELSKEVEERLVQSVTADGLGLVMAGGRASFGAGGWHKRSVEELLPVEFVQKEEKRDPSTSLVIVIDTSGSMTGVRVQLAKEVSRLAMKRLLPHDKVGIVEFHGAKRWAAPLQPASNAIELQRALNRMDAGGGTVILPALEEAFYGLQNVDTRYKHVLVLTDGGVESGDFESLMRRMAGEGINVSTVLAGGGYHSEFLVNIANWGKGRFYNVPNRFNLPEILLKQPSTTKLPAYRPGVHMVQARGGSGWWGDVDLNTIPALAGYVEGKARIGAEVLLETSKEKHPLLSTWRYGLGRVTTLNTEPLGEGTKPWQDWPDYGQAMARILERSAADAYEPFRYSVQADGGEIVIHAQRQQPRVPASSGNLVSALPLARILSQDAEAGAEPKSLNFLARSPDHFLCRLPAPKLGKHLKMQTSASNTPQRWQPLVALSPIVEENRVDPHSAKEFGEMIESVGGNRFAVGDDWTNTDTPAPRGKRLFSPASILFGLTLLLFLAELVWRRIPRQTFASSNTSQTSSRGTNRAVAAALLFAVLMGIFASAQKANAQPIRAISTEVHDAIQAMAAASDQAGWSQSQIAKLFDRAVISDGTVQPTLDWLSRQRGDFSDPKQQTLGELEVHIASRFGDLARASLVLNLLLEQESVRESRLDLLVWQAKLEDALGNAEKARKLYEGLTKRDLPDEMQQAVRLRLSLIDLIGGPPTPGTRPSNNAKPLIELAEKSEDIDFRNRAANVLAVQNKHADAIKLFTIRGTGTQRFRSASRVAEWAIRANNREKAIDSAWDAVDSSQLKRDRNYALALLVESYRMKEKKKGLEVLVGKFKERDTAEDKSGMSVEMRNVWISLLRELGKYDEAIALFKESASGETGFTVEMRRELLEMEGEAGYEDRMLESYRELIRREPDELIWRSGLTLILLEKGKEEESEALWKDFIQKTNRGPLLLASAQSLGEFGLDALCLRTIERMVSMKLMHGQALLYWADLQARRGEVELAEETLNRVQKLESIGDDVLAELASAYERLGRQDKAIEVNEAIRASRETVAEDLEMRLAWLYSEVGDEEKALEQWLALWRKITSIPRRRYVEDRLMTVASRLGTLADIAIDLEEKLAEGTADDREAGLLIRIYSRVNDSIAATEISEEYMAQSGKNQVERLQEKGRIYQICNDYWNYEQVIEQLIEVDPDGKTEYLRQLALSMLERGKAQEARDVLMTLRTADDGKDSIGGEFEAGVLSLVGMNKEAAQAYRKGIATYPDRIESYLLLANLLKDMGLTDRAVGMFQYLAENAERDDLFTIAIDGILNMQARGPTMQWARRITLERLAGREDKNYLYQLLADLSFEVNDKAGQIRAMENSLAVSGTRRLSVLRECMELSSRIRGGVYYSSSSRGPTNKGNTQFFAFGRRLIGLGELMPPQVFLDLGQAFLDDGDAQSAERTFGMARNLADPRGYQREVAMIFEKAGKTAESLERNDKLLRTSPSDVALIARVAKLNEQESKDEAAFRFYQRGLELLLAQTPMTTQEDSSNKQVSFWSSNRDAYQTYSQQLLQGLLVTVPEGKIEDLLDRQQKQIEESFTNLDRLAETGRNATALSDSPRIEKQAELSRKMCIAFGRIDRLETIDHMLVNRFVEDKNLLITFARERISSGRYDSVERSLKALAPSEAQQEQLLQMLGRAPVAESETSKLNATQMWKRLIPAWMKDDRSEALKILRRVDQNQARSPGGYVSYVIINGMAVPKSTGSASDVTAWMRLAKILGDEGLALQFARSTMGKSGGPYAGPQFRQQLISFKEILPAAAYGDLIRYIANAIKENKQRTADYLWLITKEKEHLAGQIPGDDELLEIIEGANLQINYYFPFSMALEVFPESIRTEALSTVLSSIVDKYRPRELITVPFMSEQAIAPDTADAVLEWLESGIAPAMQDDYLRYCTYNLPRAGTAVRNPANVEFALKALDLLLSDRVRKKEKDVPRIAGYIKAVVLKQAGRTEEALEIVLKDYDPNENLTDYYTRNSQTWAHQELVPVATDRFLAKIDESAEDKKISVQLTDKKIAIVRQTNNEDLLRQTYRQAITDHPEQSKFTSAYERWEQSKKRKLIVLELIQEQIAAAEKAKANAKTDAEKNKANTLMAKVPSLRKRLETQWQSLDHMPNALASFTIDDDADIKRFKEEEKKQEKEQVEKETKEETGDKKATQEESIERLPSPKQKPAANKPAVNKPAANKVSTKIASAPIGRPPSPATKNAQTVASNAATKPKKPAVYSTSMAGVKKALDAEDTQGAQKTLRKIWRSYPPAVASPYGFAGAQKRINGLAWPTTPPKTADKPKEPSEKERQIAAEKARQRARGGLGTFEPGPITHRKKPSNAWKELAKYPFAVEEMRRLKRSQLSPNRMGLGMPTGATTTDDVAIGLLQAKRNSDGDDAVLTELIQNIRAGHLSQNVLAGFFMMVEEDYSRINEKNIGVVDVLLERLDLTNSQRANQLALLCAKVGLKNRSKALYRHCALIGKSAPNNFGTVVTSSGYGRLLGEAKECFEGEELLDLAEKMFEVTGQGLTEATELIQLREELLSPEEAAQKCIPLLENAPDESTPNTVRLAVTAVRILSRVGDYKNANRYLEFLLDRTGKPRTMSNDPYRMVVSSANVRNLLVTSRRDLIQMFPEAPEDFQDYGSWLENASSFAREKAETATPAFVQELLLTIALRQCQAEQFEQAQATLSALTPELLAKSKSHSLLTIDLFRLAKMPERALQIEKREFQNKSLSHLRFGDLLQDTFSTEGEEAAAKQLEKLAKYSLHSELLDAAEAIGKASELLASKTSNLKAAQKVARENYEARKEAATKRNQKRSQWRQAAAKNAPPPAGKPAGKPAQAAAIQQIKNVPARILKRPIP